MIDPALDAYLAMVDAEANTPKVTDPDEVEELRRRARYLPSRRRWPWLRGGLAPAPTLEPR